MTLPVTTALAAQETIIERGLHTFVEVGTALATVRDERLYRVAHETFEAYCRERWGFDRTYAHRVIGAAEVVSVLPNGNRPTTESQARELAPLKADPPRLVLAAETAQATAAAEDRAPTARDYAEAVEVIRDAPAEVVEKPKDLLPAYIAKRKVEEEALGMDKFSWINGAADDLRKLPELNTLWLPRDRGNVDYLDASIRLLQEQVPQIADTWARHLETLDAKDAA